MRRKGREFLSWGLRKKGTKKGNEQPRSAPIKAKTEMMDLYASSQGTTPSPGERYRRSRSRRERDFGGSHREYERPSIRTRVSSENDETDDGGSRDY